MGNPTKNIYTSFKYISESKTNLRKLIFEDSEISERASDLRGTAISKLGWKEKGQELSSGGDLNSQFTSILNQLFTEYNQLQPRCKGVFTSGNDKYHQNIKSYKSLHSSGLAVDVTLDSGCHSSFIEILKKYIQKFPGFSFINEYATPSAKSTGGHFHLSYRSGNPETTSTYDSKFENNLSASNNSKETGSEEIPSVNSQLVAMKRDPVMSLVSSDTFKKMGFGESVKNKKKVISEGLDLGKKVDYSSSYAIIPKEQNKKIYSAIDGKIDNLKYISGCNNQLMIKSSDGKNYLLYCGISNVYVSDGDRVSVKDSLGSTDTDVKVTLYNSKFEPIKLSKDTNFSKNEKDKLKDINRGYKDPALGLLASPVQSFKKFFGIKNKDKGLNENISRIKSLLK